MQYPACDQIGEGSNYAATDRASFDQIGRVGFNRATAIVAGAEKETALPSPIIPRTTQSSSTTKQQVLIDASFQRLGALQFEGLEPHYMGCDLSGAIMPHDASKEPAALRLAGPKKRTEASRIRASAWAPASVLQSHEARESPHAPVEATGCQQRGLVFHIT